MILSRRVSLGGYQLDEVNEAIVIQNVDTGVPHESVSAVNRMGGAGQRMTSQHWETLEVSVTFAIDLPKRNLEARREVFDAVNAWALGGKWLKTNERPGRRMYVDKVVLPGAGDLWNWTNEYTIVFRAYNVPFWQDEVPAQAVSSTASGGTVYIQAGGNMESVLDVTVANKSGKEIQNLWVQANGNRITLGSLGLGGSETLTISHGNDGLLRIKKGSTSVYNKYSGADDLYVTPGNVAVTWGADRAVQLTVVNYGRYV